MTVQRSGSIARMNTGHPSVESYDFDGIEVEVGDLVKVTPPGKKPCLAKVAEIRLESVEGPVREVTVALWSKLNGNPHLQKGLTRVLTPNNIIGLKRQPAQREKAS